MKDNPSSFGYATVDIGSSFAFAGIKTNYMFFSYSGLNHINKHIDDTTLAKVLDNAKDTTVLGLDYRDRKSTLPRKTILLEESDGTYAIALVKKAINKIEIDSITTLHLKEDVKGYLEKAIENGSSFYKNEKSDSFLARNLLSTEPLSSEDITSWIIITEPTGDVKSTNNGDLKHNISDNSVTIMVQNN